jgi:hypothetical protein
MRSLSPLTLAVLILTGLMTVVLHADYLKNTDFKEGFQLWRGDGQAAFLNPDGTEGSEGDPGVIPVIKITLAKGHTHAVFQEFDAKDAPSKLHVKVEVYASADFKRSNRASDYNTDDFMPNTDFAVRLMPDYYQQSSDLKPGQWVTVKYTWMSPTPADQRAVYFIVPPGDGTVYIRNPSVSSTGG